MHLSLTDLVQYLEGSADKSLRSRIETLVESDPEFAEEMEEWQAFIEESGTIESGIQKIRQLHQQWEQTAIPLLSDQDHDEKKRIDGLQPKSESKRPFYFKLAAAAAILLVGIIFGWKWITSSGQQNSPVMIAEAHIQDEVEGLLDIEMGGTEGEYKSFDQQLAAKLRQKAYGAAVISLDSLLAIHPKENKYTLLKALFLSRAGEDQEALQTLKTLAALPDLSAEFNCKILWNLALIYLKTQQKEDFDRIKAQWKEKTDQSWSCYELDSGKNQLFENDYLSY